MELKKFTVSEILDYLNLENPSKSEKERFTGGGFVPALDFGRGMNGFAQAVLQIPETIVIMVSPIGCGRHVYYETLAAGIAPERFWHIHLNEQEIVTGAASRIDEMVLELVDSLDPKPRGVYIMCTCVDALLHTDYRGVKKKLMERYGTHFSTIGMYPFLIAKKDRNQMNLMTSMYNILEPSDKKIDNRINLLGNTFPLSMDTDLIRTLTKAGFEVREVRSAKTFDDFEEIASSRLNLVLNGHTLPVAKSMEVRFGVKCLPFMESMDPELIRSNYQALEAELGVKLDYEEAYEKARVCAEALRVKMQGKRFGIGAGLDYCAMKSAAEFASLGADIKYIWTKYLDEDHKEYFERINALGQDPVVYITNDLAMEDFKNLADYEIDAAIGLMGLMMLGIHGHTTFSFKEEAFDFETFCRAAQHMIERFDNPPQPMASEREATEFDRCWKRFERRA